MGVLLIITGIIVLAVATSLLFKWTDKRRQTRRDHQQTEARAFVAAHAVAATTIRQAYDCKDVDARLLAARLAAADPEADRQEAHAAQVAAIAYLDSCEEMATELSAIIAYDHKHFKKMPANYQDKIVAPHEKWHETLDSLRSLALGIEDQRKRYVI